MNILNLELSSHLPEAHKDNPNIMVYHCLIDDLSFIDWGRTKIEVNGQLSKGFKDMKGFIMFLIGVRLGAAWDLDGRRKWTTWTVGDDLRNRLISEGWSFEGEWRVNESDTFVRFDIYESEVKQFLKNIK